MFKYIKENWLMGVIAGAIGSIITIVIINHWYSKNVSDVITSWVVALSSLAVAGFAWMAYKYAIDSFLEQKHAKRVWNQKYKIIKNLIKNLHQLQAQIKEVCNVCYIFDSETKQTKGVKFQIDKSSKAVDCSDEMTAKLFVLPEKFIKNIDMLHYNLSYLKALTNDTKAITRLKGLIEPTIEEINKIKSSIIDGINHRQKASDYDIEELNNALSHISKNNYFSTRIEQLEIIGKELLDNTKN